MFETKISHAHIPSGRRIFVTSDIHGHGHLLRRLLERVNFSHDDTLIIAGDILEKGPDSLGTLRYVMSLCREYDVYPLMGNVDGFALSHFIGIAPENASDVYNIIHRWKSLWGSTLFHEMAAELSLPLNCPEDALACRAPFLQHFTQEIEFLSQLPTVLITQNFIFTHSGLRERNPEDNTAHGMFSLTKYDDFMNATPNIFDKFVVVGHWPVILYREHIPSHEPCFHLEKHIISIDGGCGVKEDGQLNLLCIPDMDCSVESITWERCDDLPTVIALEDQSPSTDSISINWHTRQLTILEKGDEFTRIRHHHTGRELTIPTAYLYSDTECRDYTDFCLPVRKGDRLSVTHETSRGIIAKKNGVVGWYTGSYK